MQKEPPPFVWAVPDERNLLTWNFIIRGPPDSPYAGGEFHGVLLFPSEYPFKPPGIKMFTPSGRFQPDKKICFSMSDFHPGLWNPAWSVATILTGLLSFMLSDEMTTGSVTSSDAHKRAFASRSHAWNITQHRFKDAFPEFCSPLPKDLPNMGEKERGTPPPSVSSPHSSPTHPSNQMQASNSTSSTGSVPSVTSSTSTPKPTRPPGVRPEENRMAATGWVTTWKQLLMDRWHLWGLLALAVLVSKFSSSA